MIGQRAIFTIEDAPDGVTMELKYDPPISIREEAAASRSAQLMTIAVGAVEKALKNETGAPPDSIKARMQAIGSAIAAQLPDGYGFFVLCFPFHEPDPQGQYVSNASRGDVVAVMKNFLERNPMQEMGRN